METCYKVFSKDVADKIIINENRFGLEPELTAKVAKLKGVLHVSKDFNYKEALGQILLERYNKLK